MKQAAQDLGGQFTNRQEITGANGEPTKTEEIKHATDAQVKTAVDKALEEY